VGRQPVPEDLAHDEAVEAQREVLRHPGSEVAPGDDHPVVAEVLEQLGHVVRAGHRIGVGAAVGRDLRVAEPAVVGHDHLEAGVGKRVRGPARRACGHRSAGDGRA
jgi:hypothetical protein